MTALMDLAGHRFGRLVVIRRGKNDPGRHTRWLCRCACGSEIDVERTCLLKGWTRSCGCIRVETTAARSITHQETVGRERTPEYACWLNMRNRCSGKHPQSRKHYFDRGIRVCAEWENSFEAFLAHVGRRPSPAHSIDRMDNNGHYEPGNVRWATGAEQQRNKRWNGRQPKAA